MKESKFISIELLQKGLAEYIGTFAIVFCGCGAVAINQISDGRITHVGIALTFGLTVMTMIYAVGHISKAHFNPAVTIAFACTRHSPVGEVIPYILFQLFGAITASFIHVATLAPVLRTISPGMALNLGVTQPIDDSFWTAFLWEYLLTFVLMFVIIAVATDDRVAGGVAGLAIGATVALEALFAGALCGASMNPARSFGPALAAGQWRHLLAYILGPVCGAICGGLFYQLIRGSQPDLSKMGSSDEYNRNVHVTVGA